MVLSVGYHFTLSPIFGKAFLKFLLPFFGKWLAIAANAW
jgi:hypothetical protein